MAELKIKADSGGGTVSFKGPTSTTDHAAVQLTLPVDDGTSGQYLKTDGSGVLSWATVSTAEQDASTGDYTLTSGNLVIATSGKGIDFSATSDAAGKTSELLDDYEEGTWTPSYSLGQAGSLTAAAYESNTGGTYVKVGRLVSFTCNIECSSHTANSGVHMLLTGLPFTSENTNQRGGAWVTYGTAVDSGNSGKVPTFNIANNATYLGLYYTNGANWPSDHSSAAWNSRLEITGHYIAAS